MEDLVEQPSTKQIVIKWGLILGFIAILVSLIIYMTGTVGGPLPWTTSIASIIVIVLAHREYKSYGDSYMSYGKGLGIGTLISLVSSLVSALFAYIYLKFIGPEYMNLVKEEQIRSMEESGMGDDQIEQAMEISSFFMSPEFTLIIGIFGGVLIGLILSLIISAFTKNNDPSLEI